MSLACENVTLKDDVGEKGQPRNKARREASFFRGKHAALSDRADAAAYAPSTSAGPPVSCIELKLLNTRATTAENAAVAIGRQRDGYLDGMPKYSRQARDAPSYACRKVSDGAYRLTHGRGTHHL